MWPDLFGPGWIWGVLTAGCLFGIFLALIWGFADFQMPRGDADPLLEIWHQYEQGELTHREFERAKRSWAPAGYSLEVVRREKGNASTGPGSEHAVGARVRVPPLRSDT
jgi:hypothetical protein